MVRAATGAALVATLACQTGREPATPRIVDAPADEATAALELSELPSAPLIEGAVLDLDLVAGSAWSAGLEVAEESLFSLVVEQRGLDVRLSLMGSTPGHEIAAVDGPGGVGPDERLALRLPAGSYRVFLSPSTDGPTGGRVRLRVDALRGWLEGDAERIRLIGLCQEATHLDASNARSDWERAHTLSLEELEGWRRLGETSAVVRTLNRIGSLERELGSQTEAIDRGREAVRLSLDAGDSRGEAAARYWLAQSLYRAGHTEEAAEELQRGLDAAELAADLRLQGRILNWQGRVAWEQGRLETADALYARALTVRTAARDTKGISAILNNRGNANRRLGRATEAMEYYREAVRIARQLGSPGGELTPLTNLGQLLLDRGQWQEALDTFQECLDKAIALGDRRNEAHLEASLAPLLLKLGEPEAALDMLRSALAIERDRGDYFKQLSILTTQGWIYGEAGNLEAADEALDEALRICRKLELETKEGTILRAKANLRLLQRRAAEALELLDQAARITGNQPVEQARTQRARAETLLAMGEADEALSALSSATGALGGLPAPEVRFEIAFQRARALRAQGALDASLEAAEFALGIVESLRSSVSDSDLRATYLSRVLMAYDFTVELLLALDAGTEGDAFARRAFETFERAKARSLIELLARARSGADAKVDPSLIEAERQALAEVARLHDLLAAEISAAGGMTETIAGLQTDLEKSQLRLLTAERRIRETAPEYAAIRYLSPIAVEDVQSRLEPGTTLIEYALRDEFFAAFVITAHSFEVVELGPADKIDSWVPLMREAVRQRSRRSYGRFAEAATALGEGLIRPVLARTPSSRHLVVVTDGPLSYIPFEALLLDEGDYLIESLSVAYAPSAGVFVSLGSGEASGNEGSGLVAFSDPVAPTFDPPWEPLPGSRREAQAIARIFPERALVLSDRHASEHRLKAEPAVRRARWLHLASHAWVDERNPARTSIVLAADDQGRDDGYLGVAEVFGLDLAAELVVLSGCETALGRQVRGEGLLGLTRAFLYAGARAVQVSLWKVGDESTPELMSDFYDALGSGADPAEALRHAKLASLSDPARAHPFHWAPFVLIGGSDVGSGAPLPSRATR